MKIILLIWQMQITDDPVEILMRVMMFVKALMILYIEKNIKTTRRTDRESKNIDEAKSATALETTECNFKKISYHDDVYLLL
jgi:hypothetical protein